MRGNSQDEEDPDFISEDQQVLASYINANYINGLVRGHHKRSMIACSGPTPKTQTKFWQMIWENKVPLIAMVCPFIGTSEECFNYWNNLTEIG